MTSLCESQAFLDQFDKVLPLCEKGDAVTVINALHVLNSITQASIAQAHELGRDRDFVCSFLLELELALELYISPSRKLGTQDGGLPALYSFGEDEVAQLAAAPSRATKAKVLKFLDALGVAPSPEFAERTVAETVSQFLGFQVKPTHPKKERAKRGNISWADQCSSGSDSDSDCSSLPSLEEDDEDVCTPSPSSSKQRSPRSSVASVEEYEVEEYEEEEEEEEIGTVFNAAAAIFLSPAPFHNHVELSEQEASHASHPRSSGPAAASQKRAGVAPADRAPRPDPFYKTRLCKNYMSPAGCHFGQTCNFAHGEDDLRAEATLVALSSAGVSAPPARAPAPEGGKGDASLFKTRMCANYEKHGYCKYNDRCLFAHGAAELRRPRKGSKGAQHSKCEQDL